MKLGDIQIRDPFLLTVPEEATYYLYGSTDKDIWQPPATGFDGYRSTDLQDWEGPIPVFRPSPEFWSDRNYWAPEVHPYRGRFYMFATFASATRRRGTQILVSDGPEGPFVPLTGGPITPAGWECLDGTLFVDDKNDPWLVFCHEWIQVANGEVVAQRLSTDLVEPVGDPAILFHGSDAPWARPFLDDPRSPDQAPAFITDGPFLHRSRDGELIMLWSGFGDHGYAMGIAHSTTGLITGPWTQEPEPLWAADGGHGMIASTLDGALLLSLHQPNNSPYERAHFFALHDDGATVRLQ